VRSATRGPVDFCTVPVAPAILRLAAPNFVQVIATLVLVAVEGAFVARLGPEPFAGVSLVLPIFMLMQNVAAGGFGSAVASAVARALGAGDENRARAFAFHSVIAGLVIAMLFTAVLTAIGRPLYKFMSGSDGSVVNTAVAYSNVLFGAAVVIWLFNMISSALRGAGNMTMPALAMLLSLLTYIPLCFLLVVGWGPIRGFGAVGAAWAIIGSFLVGAIVLIWYLVRGGVPVSLRLSDLRLDRGILFHIFHLGAAGGLNAILNNVTTIVTTAFVGRLGVTALTGYGVVVRFEYLVIPIAASLGTAMLTVVGTNIGAGQRQRAERAAWIGAAMTFIVAGGLGFVAMAFPLVWMGLITSDLETQQAAQMYLDTVAPTYGLFGFGLSLYYASMGAARPGWPLAANVVRLSIVVVGGLLFGGSLPRISWVVAVAFTVYGVLIAFSLKAGAWCGRLPSQGPVPSAVQPSGVSRA
jgi:putative MATE family efflux protein